MPRWRAGGATLLAFVLGAGGGAGAQTLTDVHSAAQRIEAARRVGSPGLEARRAVARAVAEAERWLQRCVSTPATAHCEEVGPQIDALEQAVAGVPVPGGDAPRLATDQLVRRRVAELVSELRSLRGLGDPGARRLRAAEVLEAGPLTGGVTRQIPSRPPPNWQTLSPRSDE